MMAGRSAPERKSLRELLAVLDEDDSDGLIIKLVLDSAAKRDPELPDLLRACAIPRTITPEIVGVLRGAPDDTAGNKRLLDLVCSHSFVIRRPDGGFIFHDSTRDQLLADWRAPGDQGKTARYTELNNALVDYYKARYTDSLESDGLLTKVAGLIYQANPARLRRLTAAIEATMATSLQEATYHLLLTSPDRALGFFESYFFELEQANRVTIVAALISFIRDFAARHPEAANQALLLWLDYYDARIKQVFPGYDPEPMINAFGDLADNADAPAKLRYWALTSLAEVYEYKGDLAATLDTRFRLVEHEVTIDPHNDPLRYYALGGLHWQQADAGLAIGYLRRSIARVTEVDEARADLGVRARLSLARIYADLGDWAAAFDCAAEALVLARTELWRDVQVTYSAAIHFTHLLSMLAAPASDCAGAEAIAIAGAVPHDVPLVLLDCIDALIAGGRTRTASAWLSRAEGERYSPRVPLIRFEILYRRSTVAATEQRRKDCEAICSQLLAELPERPETNFTRIAILLRRGWQRAELGDGEGATSDYILAREAYEWLGYTTHAALAAARLAGVTAKSGNIPAARDLLATADAGIPRYPTLHRGELLEATGDVAEAVSDWRSARDHFEQFLGLVTARRDLVNQAHILRKLATLHEKVGEVVPSADYARREAQVRDRIAELDAPATTAQLRAHAENGVGIRHFCQAGDRSAALDLARQHFTLAAELDPDNLWPLLNLSFTYAEQEDWLEAARALARALELSPKPLRTAPRLAQCLRDYVLRYLSYRFAFDDDWQAKAAAATTAVQRVAGLLPTADLAPALAMQAVALVLSGDAEAGREACRKALSCAAPGTGFADATAPLAATPGDYWAVDDALRVVEETRDAPEELREKASAARAALRDRLDALMGLAPPPAEEELPVTPIVLEVGEGLVPIVDSNQDGGMFLHSLIPAMRDRIKAEAGVTVPGVRARGNYALPARGYSIQVDEIPVLAGELPAGAVAVKRGSEADLQGGTLIDFDPRTGKPGIWALRELTSDGPHGASAREDDLGALTAPEYLANRIEVAVRAHLARYLGPQEVALLVDAWAEEPAEPGTPAPREIVPDADAVLSLTWLLQRLVSDAIPVTEWGAILAAVRDAGGLTTPGDDLYRAVRCRLRPQLPGQLTGRSPINVPGEYEQALTATDDDGTDTSRTERRVEFLAWLRQQVTAADPAITLITRTQEGREAVAALARTRHRLITALTWEEAYGDA
jgi:tetratricopeptide (TPR) repeat protein